MQAVTLWAGAQAVLAYRVPLAGSLDRPQRKVLHAALHSAALLCIVLALVAAFQSHNLKRPAPTPNLYSPHSYLGLAVTILAFLQARPAPRRPAFAAPCVDTRPVPPALSGLRGSSNACARCSESLCSSACAPLSWRSCRRASVCSLCVNSVSNLPPPL